MEACGDIGAVTRHDVLRVLCSAGVRIVKDGDEFTLSADDVLESQRLPASVPRRMVHRLARLFDVPIHSFYHPSDPLRLN